jgi:hypothetical protein
MGWVTYFAIMEAHAEPIESAYKACRSFDACYGVVVEAGDGMGIAEC